MSAPVHGFLGQAKVVPKVTGVRSAGYGQAPPFVAAYDDRGGGECQRSGRQDEDDPACDHGVSLRGGQGSVVPEPRAGAARDGAMPPASKSPE